ncbi:HAD family hydrolase [Paenibacillus sp.]|uniref:HAD family hydrolase n=1 Tax=Paenibacillus sp. TaxID=58172 RepID=UPI002D45C1DE|nr:HAD family hydrolase [Paenibacillus sp.]HZG88482.1 HAD family hydrolase [Paenibacillus sp.]
MNKKAVLFDLDDTLLWDERSVQEAFDMTCREAAEAAGVDPKALELAVRKEARALYESYETFPFTQMIGINPFEGLWGNFREGAAPEFRIMERIAPQYRAESWTRGLRALGVDDPELGAKLGERFPAIRRTLAYVYEETYEVLDALKGNVKLLLLTNGSPDLQKEKLTGVPKLAPYFDHIIISGDFGRGKPDPSIFRHAVELLGIDPSEGIMIGDKLTTDILGSSRIGMDNIWINHHGAEIGEHVPPKHTVTRLKDILSIV